MIVYRTGDMLAVPGIPVIPVNCVGVMGKGLAKQAAEKWPWILSEYKMWCKHGAPMLSFSKPVWVSNGQITVCLLATKIDWRNPLDIEFVEASIEQLSKASWPAAIFNVPKLGCGLGGLDWKDVKPLMEKHLTDAPGTFNVWE